MADVVNLRMVRKAKRRVEAEDAATQNRTKFGQNKTERTKIAAETASYKRTLDGAKRET